MKTASIDLSETQPATEKTQPDSKKTQFRSDKTQLSASDSHSEQDWELNQKVVGISLYEFPPVLYLRLR